MMTKKWTQFIGLFLGLILLIRHAESSEPKIATYGEQIETYCLKKFTPSLDTTNCVREFISGLKLLAGNLQDLNSATDPQKTQISDALILARTFPQELKASNDFRDFFNGLNLISQEPRYWYDACFYVSTVSGGKFCGIDFYIYFHLLSHFDDGSWKILHSFTNHYPAVPKSFVRTKNSPSNPLRFPFFLFLKEMKDIQKADRDLMLPFLRGLPKMKMSHSFQTFFKNFWHYPRKDLFQEVLFVANNHLSLFKTPNDIYPFAKGILTIPPKLRDQACRLAKIYLPFIKQFYPSQDFGFGEFFDGLSKFTPQQWTQEDQIVKLLPLSEPNHIENSPVYPPFASPTKLKSVLLTSPNSSEILRLERKKDKQTLFVDILLFTYRYPSLFTEPEDIYPFASGILTIPQNLRHSACALAIAHYPFIQKSYRLPIYGLQNFFEGISLISPNEWHQACHIASQFPLITTDHLTDPSFNPHFPIPTGLKAILLTYAQLRKNLQEVKIANKQDLFDAWIKVLSETPINAKGTDIFEDLHQYIIHNILKLGLSYNHPVLQTAKTHPNCLFRT